MFEMTSMEPPPSTSQCREKPHTLNLVVVAAASAAFVAEWDKYSIIE
jgi:hypothetical protein